MPPNGSRGHRVILTTQAARNALDSLEGMAVSFKSEWDGHDQRRKCGVITKAWIQGDELLVSGFLYMHDFPEIAGELRKPGIEMGMSYEMMDARVADMRAKFWSLTEVTFTGAAIMLADKAAYRSTRFQIAAAEEVFTGRLTFAPEGTILLDKKS